mmetsp:Transcript_35773/g.47072  ORF Transcript_35773/g.47072 Transcript_35773/m.47072 type:complete len:84 (-) Transcript_35773:2521-2772(-)
MNSGPSQPHLTPDGVGGSGFGGDSLQSDLLLQQLQQIQQYVQTQPDLLSGAPNNAGGAGMGNPEGNNPTTPQNILAALADIQK